METQIARLTFVNKMLRQDNANLQERLKMYHKRTQSQLAWDELYDHSVLLELEIDELRSRNHELQDLLEAREEVMDLQHKALEEQTELARRRLEHLERFADTIQITADELVNLDIYA